MHEWNNNNGCAPSGAIRDCGAALIVIFSGVAYLAGCAHHESCETSTLTLLRLNVVVHLPVQHLRASAHTIALSRPIVSSQVRVSLGTNNRPIRCAFRVVASEPFLPMRSHSQATQWCPPTTDAAAHCAAAASEAPPTRHRTHHSSGPMVCEGGERPCSPPHAEAQSASFGPESPCIGICGATGLKESAHSRCHGKRPTVGS